MRTSLETRGDDGTGWSLAWKINFWARLHDGDHALKILDRLLRPAYGVGVQILLQQGVRRMKLLSNRRRMPSMTGYGLEVTGFLSTQD